MNSDNVTYLIALELNIFQKKLKNLEAAKISLQNTAFYRIQTNDSIICGYFCIGFIDFMLKGKNLLDYINLFSPNEYENKDKIILKYFNNSKLRTYFS